MRSYNTIRVKPHLGSGLCYMSQRFPPPRFGPHSSQRAGHAPKLLSKSNGARFEPSGTLRASLEDAETLQVLFVGT